MPSSRGGGLTIQIAAASMPFMTFEAGFTQLHSNRRKNLLLVSFYAWWPELSILGSSKITETSVSNASANSFELLRSIHEIGTGIATMRAHDEHVDILFPLEIKNNPVPLYLHA